MADPGFPRWEQTWGRKAIILAIFPENCIIEFKQIGPRGERATPPPTSLDPPQPMNDFGEGTFAHCN